MLPAQLAVFEATNERLEFRFGMELFPLVWLSLPSDNEMNFAFGPNTIPTDQSDRHEDKQERDAAKCGNRDQLCGR